MDQILKPKFADSICVFQSPSLSGTKNTSEIIAMISTRSRVKKLPTASFGGMIHVEILTGKKKGATGWVVEGYLKEA